MKNKLLIVFILFGQAFFSKGQSFDPILAAGLQNTIDSMRTATAIKGISACVIYPGQGTWKGVSGISHAGTPITSEMEFGIASNTKLFTAVLILKLAENNLLGLDDSLYEYLPAYNNIDSNITVRQLLNHISGLDDVTSVPGYPDSMLTNPNRIFTASELMTWAGPPLFSPGTGWNYCNTNYLLAGLVAESATGFSYGRLLHDSILTPLQLDSTFLDVYDSILYVIAHPWQAGVDNIAVPRKSVNSAAWAAGAMYSTAGEMAQWYQALMNGQVLNQNSFNELTTFVGSGSYGMGISEATVNGRTVWQHGGAIWGGYNSFMMYDTATGIIICVLINQLPAQPQAFQVAIQLLSTITNPTSGFAENLVHGRGVTLYPNPTNDLVQVDVPEDNVRSIRIFGPAGELLKTSAAPRFTVSDLSAGLYYILVDTDKGAFMNKLIKR